MRYIIMGVIILGCVVLGTAVFTEMTIFGVEPDLLLIVMVCMVMTETTAMPVVFTVFGALLIDMLFGRHIGFYAVPYAVAGVVAFFFSTRKFIGEWYFAPLVCGLSYLAKELSACALSFLLGFNFDFTGRLFLYIFPGALIMAGISLVIIIPIKLLYSFNLMKPNIRLSDEKIAIKDQRKKYAR